MHRLLNAMLGAALIPAAMLSAQTPDGEPFNAETFAPAVAGLVFDVRDQGVVRQREQFLEGNQVRLGFVPEGQSAESLAPIPCVDGEWYEDQGAICFEYTLPNGATDGPHCWEIFDNGNGQQTARAVSPGSELVLDLNVTETPLICQGPDIGV